MWNCIKTAVQGKSHILDNTPCQDKVYSLSEGNYTSIALADGAGSAKYSHFGAETVVRTICEDFITNFLAYFAMEDGLTVKKQIIGNILISLKKVSEEKNCELKDLASTLLAVTVHNNDFILLHIGDGVIGYLTNEELKVASKPNNGEFVNTTVFTISENVVYSMKVIKGNLNNINGFILMSDGCEVSLYHKKENKISQSLKRIMNLIPLVSLEKLENALERTMKNIISKNTTDDCSLVILRQDNYGGYSTLSKNDKCKLFHIADTKTKYERFDSIMYFLQQKKNLKQIAKHIHLKPKYTKKKYIDKLLKENLIEKIDGNYYLSLIVMEKIYHSCPIDLTT